MMSFALLFTSGSRWPEAVCCSPGRAWRLAPRAPPGDAGLLVCRPHLEPQRARPPRKLSVCIWGLRPACAPLCRSRDSVGQHPPWPQLPLPRSQQTASVHSADDLWRFPALTSQANSSGPPRSLP